MKEFKTMSSHVMPVRSTLLCVALVIRSKDGPRFVFHYPPRLTQNETKKLPRYGTELDPTPPEASDEDSSSEDDLEEEQCFDKKFSGMGLEKKSSHHVSKWDGDDHFESVEGVHIVPWEHLNGFSTQDLASILTPTRAYHKKCFELTLDPLHFVSYAMHIRENGEWKKRRKFRKRKEHKVPGTIPEIGSTSGYVKAEFDDKYVYGVTGVKTEPGTGDDDQDGNATGLNVTGSENDADDLGMTMFNLVFILNPNRMEASTRVADIFEHVAKDMNKALRYAQHYSNYVSKESDRILTMKEKAREDSESMEIVLIYLY
jgi:nitrogen permease regulator 3-like protein